MGVSTLGDDKSVVIIGGGIFGLSTAIILGEKNYSVTVLEKENDIMTKASLVNQNRIHMGYHYPRSIETGKESLNGIENFKKYYGKSINSNFKKYYAIANKKSKVSANEFYNFCMDLKLPLEEKYPRKDFLDRTKVEACWLTPEPVFDFGEIKNIIISKISNLPNVKLLRNTEVSSIHIKNDLKIIDLKNGPKLNTRYVVNATYSNIPKIANKISQNDIIGQYELCMMPIIKSNFKNENQFGITVMDGPFCSIMPKGFNKGEYILYHVEQSVLQRQKGASREPWESIVNFPELNCIEECKNYFPILDQMVISDSWITTRIVLPDKEKDDARPTLMINHENGIYSIFSGKVTTAIDAGYQILNAINLK